ncbi:hypothetical protein E4U48_004511 [Claviceps purpurea]|nr:hypothetical protein E4U48_004511 [Claviceps purpurea]
MKFLKVGRVAIITRGRYAGKKVVIVQPVDNGNKPHPFGHAVVAGIERYPSKVTRRMSKSRQEKRSKIKPFIKVINYNHLMPTRYTLELEGLKGAISADTFKEVSQREDAKKNVKKVLEDRYTSGKNRWFFTPLRTSQSPPKASAPNVIWAKRERSECQKKSLLRLLPQYVRTTSGTLPALSHVKDLFAFA